MATVADELLNDFEDSGSEGQEENDNLDSQDGTVNGSGLRRDSESNGMNVDGDDDGVNVDGDGNDEQEPRRPGVEAEDEEEAKARVEKMQLGGVSDVRSVASLMSQLKPVMEKISHYQSLPPEKQTKNIGSIEDNPEYKLLTQSNTLSTQIDSEVILVHKFIRDHYSVRFPELERLVQNPLDYARTVAVIGNGPMENVKQLSQTSDNMIKQPLKQILAGPILMTVTVEATITRGQDLSEPELTTIRLACQMVIDLDRAKTLLTDYVQSRMNLFAPNLTALIGSKTAAQLINFAGGINGLAKTPACNLPPLGSKKQSQSGMATNVGLRHQGFLYFSPIIADTGVPSDLKRQALRIVSAKTILAARVDAAHESPSGATGEDLRQQCLDRLDKLQEPPPNKGVRALPAPDDKPARKRGGRRARKAKEATAMTDLRKAQNRMAFGKEEAETGYGTGDSTKGMGMIGAAETGRVRAQQIDQRTRAKLSKKNPGWGGGTASVIGGPGGIKSTFQGFGGAAGAGNASVLRNSGLRTSGVGGAGTSSIAFTPVQGLELVDPKAREEMNRKRKADEDRWFKGGTFTQVGGGKTDAAGFKVPALPNKKPNIGK
ncbi:Nop domain-containing protein [Myriangium duriaei CBS 260.36]|uniref:Nop domain-containing protein n=1 Tax=Myriangium duriaei CBS 260.36 TaxID=1168546 RepID=A0A9P4MGB4_9PEZI|nr:Nop domain-containing protein [Myriangium duriaei CBS 260.36]